MMLAVNLMLCLFILCIFGVLDKPLQYLSLRPSVGSLLCLVTAGLLLLEDVQLTNALLANPGGFFMPVVGAVALCANERPGTRKYLVSMAVLIGVGAWMFNQITYRALEAVQEYIDILQGAFCLLFACLMDNRIKPVLMMSIIGFHLCDVMGYVVTITGGQTAYMVLGDGIKSVVMLGLVTGSVSVCRFRVYIKRLWHKRVKQSQTKAQPNSI